MEAVGALSYRLYMGGFDISFGTAPLVVPAILVAYLGRGKKWIKQQEVLVNALVAEAQAQAQGLPDSVVSAVNALAVGLGRGGGQGAPQQTTHRRTGSVSCWHCGEDGHKLWTCPSAKAGKKPRCFTCGGPHVANECKENEGKAPEKKSLSK